MNRNKSRLHRLHLETLEDRTTPATFMVNTTHDDLTPGDGLFSLRKAIIAANATPGRDVIVLPAGRFQLDILGTDEDANATGDFDITDSVVIRGAGAGITNIDAERSDRIFDVFGAIDVRFVGMRLFRGATADNGGAIRAEAGNIAIVNCVVRNSQGSQGGAISGGANASVTVTGSMLRDNVALADGGGIDIGSGTLTVTSTTLRGNRAGASGGGISSGMNGNVTVTGSTVNGNVAVTDGGGISVGSGTLAVNSSSVLRNLAGSGGGGIAGSNVTVTSSTVAGNSSATSGGGIHAQSVTIAGSTISGNASVNGGGGVQASNGVSATDSRIIGNSTNGNGGGLLVATGLTTLTRSVVSGNYAGSDGGGVIADTVNVIRSTVSNNLAGSDGGGIDASDTTLDRSTVSGNVALSGNGGGLRTQTATMINSTVSGNTAVNGSGGGVAFVISGDATIRSCTVVENTALVDGGGIWRDPAATNPTRMTNTIVALDSAAGIGRDVSGDIASFGSNLIGDSTGSTGFDDITDFFGSAAAPFDPLIGPLANNGGLTKTHALLPGSFAIDRGNDANVPAGTDQRGAGFPRQKPGTALGFPRIDIGAFEL